MAKKIVDENGNTDVQKKPFYKRGWFLTLAIIVVLVIAAIGRADDSAKKVSSEHKTTSSAKVNRQTDKLKLIYTGSLFSKDEKITFDLD